MWTYIMIGLVVIYGYALYDYNKDNIKKSIKNNKSW
tara:strand:+ start:1304 stop:1411 length:108 start_codon:yes stop_codon:yes gene_type:complete